MQDKKSFLTSAKTVSLCTLLSRVLGLSHTGIDSRGEVLCDDGQGLPGRVSMMAQQDLLRPKGMVGN